MLIQKKSVFCKGKAARLFKIAFMKLIYVNAFVFLVILLLSCGDNNRDAQLQLSKVRTHYSNKEYALAKAELDSLNARYPKAIEVRKAGMALLDSIRTAENIQIKEMSDSLITIFQPQVEEKLKQFTLQKDKNYQDTGNYIPKESVTSSITTTTLRSGVGEDGRLYLESVFIGAGRHDRIKLSLKDGTYVESLPVNEDGLNYRFTNMGRTYEVIRFTGEAENDVAEFIFSNVDKPISVTLDGNTKYSYTLTLQAKTAIAKSFELSRMMLQLDSLKTAKEKAEYHLYYLDNK